MVQIAQGPFGAETPSGALCFPRGVIYPPYRPFEIHGLKINNTCFKLRVAASSSHAQLDTGVKLRCKYSK